MNMLRNIKFYLSAFAILVSTTSCLDKYPGSSIPEKEAMRTFADAEQTLTGIYASLKSNALYSGYLTSEACEPCAEKSCYCVMRARTVNRHRWMRRES